MEAVTAALVIRNNARFPALLQIPISNCDYNLQFTSFSARVKRSFISPQNVGSIERNRTSVLGYAYCV
jgi:hypothetical protein